MANRERLIDMICGRRPPNAKYSDLKKLLEMEGYTQARSKGSHFTFTKPGHYPITVPVHDKKVTLTYIDLVCTQLGLDKELEG